jgi:hypothetical protein
MRKWIIPILSVVALLLVIGRLYLPVYLQRYVNDTLDRVPEYDGKVGRITVHLIRGAYAIHDIRIVKTTGKVPVPLFRADVVDFSVQWGALFRGKAVGEVVVKEGQLNFVNGDSKRESQEEVSGEWLGVVKDLFPLRINRMELQNSQIHYRDFDSSPKVDLHLTKLDAVGTNFSNTRRPSEGLVATIEAKAIAQQKGNFTFSGRLEPSAKVPTFDINLQLTNLPAPELNDFLKAYANVDAEGGTVGFFVEAAARAGRIKGYVKPLTKDLELVELKDIAKNPIKAAWEGIVGAVSEVFTNHSKDQIASRIPFEGRLDNPSVNVWRSITSLLSNAFVKALSPSLDEKITFQSVEQGQEKKAEGKKKG